MGKLIDADVLSEEINSWGMNDYEPSDFTDAIDDAPTVEAIPKDQYETRLKADMVAMLKEIKADVTYHSSRYNLSKEQGGAGQVVWSENLYKEADIMSVLDKKISELEAADGNDRKN